MADRPLSGFFVGHTSRPVGLWAIRRGLGELATALWSHRDVGERGTMGANQAGRQRRRRDMIDETEFTQ